MKIGIIVHSKTGNTLFVAQKLKDKLSAAGHLVSLERVSAFNDEETDVQKVRLAQAPSAKEYDMIIFGAPVRGCAISSVMKAYLSGIASFEGKNISCFVTEFFPFPNMGGNQAIRQMTDICKARGAKISETGIINWISKAKREKLIAATIDKICALV